MRNKVKISCGILVFYLFFFISTFVYFAVKKEKKKFIEIQHSEKNNFKANGYYDNNNSNKENSNKEDSNKFEMKVLNDTIETGK
jgi:hypothetical protein